MEEEYEKKENSKANDTDEDFSKDDYIFLTQTYEKANCYDGMLLGIKKCIEIDNKITKEEQRLMALAYGNKISKIRANLRYVNHKYKKKLQNSNPQSNQCKILDKLKKNMESEIIEICEEVDKLIDEILVPVLDDNQNEEKIFYLKMKADYKRYLCELIPDDSNQEIVEETTIYYEEAIKAAEEILPITSSLRLGIILNYSVFLNEIKKDKENAIKTAYIAYELINPKIEDLLKERDIYKDTIYIIKMLENNLKTWGNESNTAEEEQEQ